MTCALCKADYPSSFMDVHLRKEHNIEEDPSLGPKVEKEAKPPKGPFDDYMLWAVNVDQDNMERSVSSSASVLTNYPLFTCTNRFGKPERLVLNIVPVTGNTKHLLKRLDAAAVKSEPMEESAERFARR